MGASLLALAKSIYITSSFLWYGLKGFQAELATPINSGMYVLTKEMCGMWLTDFAKTELPIPDPSY